MLLVDTKFTFNWSYIVLRQWAPTRSHQLKPELCLHIKVVSDTRSRLQPRPSEGGERKEGNVLGGTLEGVWSSGLRAVGQPPEGEAHGANSCHGETLTPLNAQPSKQRWAEHMPMGEPGWGKGEWGDPADAVEKGELTPVKWLIKVWWSPFWGANAGQDSEGNSKPSLANWAPCRPQAADRKPQIQGILLFDIFTQTDHTACMKYWWQMLLFSLPNPKPNHAEFILSRNWMMGGTGFELCRASIFYPPNTTHSDPCLASFTF